MQLTAQDRGVLLLSARESIKSLFSDLPAPNVDYKFYPDLQQPCGAFVTITKNEQLRGCIGYIVSDEPLFKTVCEVARLAAAEDPRFPPLIEQELSEILIEISVLSPPEPLTNYEDIVIGKHGLILEEENAHGVLLPQVAVEHKMNISEFLTALCKKANLHPSTWMQRPLSIKTFTADVFGEQKRRDLNTRERR